VDNSNSSTVLVAFCCCLSNHEEYEKTKQHDGVAAAVLLCLLLRCSTARLGRRMLWLFRGVVLLQLRVAAAVVVGQSRSGIASVDRGLLAAEMEKTRILPSCYPGYYLDWLDCWRSCFVEFAGRRRRVEFSDVAS